MRAYLFGLLIVTPKRYLVKRIVALLVRDDPKRFVRTVIRDHLQGYHLSANPIRLSKRGGGSLPPEQFV